MEELEISLSTKPYIFRYRPNNEHTLSELEHNYIYFPNSEKLNDPFDANCKLLDVPNDGSVEEIFEKLISRMDSEILREYFVKFRKDDPEGAFRFVQDNVQKFFSNFGIACFSISQINIMMWAMYANNHQGICLQYNIDYDKDFFNGVRAVEYVERLEKANYWNDTEENVIHNLFYKKLKLWKEEYEIRLIKTNFGKHKLAENTIRSISFGLRASDEFKNEVIDILKRTKKSIKLYETSLLEDAYGLSFREMIIK